MSSIEAPQGSRIAGLRALARLYGVQTWFTDAAEQRQHASPETLIGVLRAVGAQIETADDVTEAIAARHAQLRAEGLDPVHVAWDGHLRTVELRDPDAGGDRVQLHLRLETGEVRSWRVEPQPLPRDGMAAAPACFTLPLDCSMPLGYHRLEIESPTRAFESTIIAAPRTAHVQQGRGFGVFTPLYALHSERSWGIGDFTDFDRFLRWTHERGGNFVATLPLLASFLDAPFDPSPYSPVSRLFWNELHLDLERVPHAEPPSASVRAEIDACRAGDRVDYRRTATLKRRVLADAARRFFAAGGSDEPDFVRFLGEHPRATEYARFRAVGQRQRAGWPEWPDRLRDGEIRDADFDPADAEYHMFAQFATDRQLGEVAATARSLGTRLYLDMPLGVNADSYDVWRERHLFARGASAGAPPDALFSRGQDWGFPPLNPDAVRRDGYRYVVECLRHHLRHAGMLRLDHVMALRRLYWVPRGMDATLGAYVRYPQDEWVAMLALESRRHEATIVGEDLGTVPPEVRAAMDEHAIQRMYVVQFEANPEADPPLGAVPEPAVASLNTHDMPPFAAFWKGLDVQDQLDLGLIDEDGVQPRLDERAALRRAITRQLAAGPDAGDADGADQALPALLVHLARSDARALLVNIEDLWLETRPQNVPGTSTERPNWQHRLRFSLEDIFDNRGIRSALEAIGRLREAPGE